MAVIKLKPEHIREYLDVSTDGEYVPHKPDTLPSTYLSYAEKDFAEEDGARSAINAVGNAKRAFHLQTETLCDALGWSVLHKKKNIGFDRRLEYLSKCGILSPGLLSRLNKTRNKVEHEYFIPKLEQVRDYIDIVELYIFATGQLLKNFPYKITFELMDDEHYDKSLNLPRILNFELDQKNQNQIILRHESNEIIVSIEEPDYFRWINSVYKQYLCF